MTSSRHRGASGRLRCCEKPILAPTNGENVTEQPTLASPRDEVTRPAFARWLGSTNDVTRMFLAAGRVPGLINLAGGLPAPEIYPVAELGEMARQAVLERPLDALNYPPIEGLPELREAIAARFSAPGLRLERDNVLITTGGMQALDLLGKVLLDEGGLIAVQAPTYLGALDAWRPRAPIFRPFFLERNSFEACAALSGAQFAYTVPNFSNPTGRLVGVEQRTRLVRAAHGTGTWLVEDDPYGTLYYDTAPLPRMLSLSGALTGDRRPYDGPLVYMGTLSKEVVPGLRVGWVIAARAMIEALTVAKQGSDMATSGLSQLLASRALACELPERTLPTILRLYRSRRDALCAAMDEHLTAWFDWQVPVGGMFVWAVARDPAMDTERLLERALEAGVCVAPGSVFDPEGQDRRAIRLNFTLNPPETLDEGIRRLAKAARAMLGPENTPGRRSA